MACSFKYAVTIYYATLSTLMSQQSLISKQSHYSRTCCSFLNPSTKMENFVIWESPWFAFHCDARIQDVNSNWHFLLRDPLWSNHPIHYAYEMGSHPWSKVRTFAFYNHYSDFSYEILIECTGLAFLYRSMWL